MGWKMHQVWSTFSRKDYADCTIQGCVGPAHMICRPGLAYTLDTCGSVDRWTEIVGVEVQYSKARLKLSTRSIVTIPQKIMLSALLTSGC